MVKFTQKLDRNNKIYITKPLRQTGLFNKVEIVPNSKVAVLYQAGLKTSDVLSSLKIIMLIYNCKRNEKQKTKIARLSAWWLKKKRSFPLDLQP